MIREKGLLAHLFSDPVSIFHSGAEEPRKGWVIFGWLIVLIVTCYVLLPRRFWGHGASDCGLLILYWVVLLLRYAVKWVEVSPFRVNSFLHGRPISQRCFLRVLHSKVVYFLFGLLAFALLRGAFWSLPRETVLFDLLGMAALLLLIHTALVLVGFVALRSPDRTTFTAFFAVTLLCGFAAALMSEKLILTWSYDTANSVLLPSSIRPIERGIATSLTLFCLIVSFFGPHLNLKRLLKSVGTAFLGGALVSLILFRSGEGSSAPVQVSFINREVTEKSVESVFGGPAGLRRRVQAGVSVSTSGDLPLLLASAAPAVSGGAELSLSKSAFTRPCLSSELFLSLFPGYTWAGEQMVCVDPQLTIETTSGEGQGREAVLNLTFLQVRPHVDYSIALPKMDQSSVYDFNTWTPVELPSWRLLLSAGQERKTKLCTATGTITAIPSTETLFEETRQALFFEPPTSLPVVAHLLRDRLQKTISLLGVSSNDFDSSRDSTRIWNWEIPCEGINDPGRFSLEQVGLLVEGVQSIQTSLPLQ